MASINASTTGVGGIITTADNTGILQLQTAGVTAMTIDASQNITFTNTPSASAMTLLGTITPTAVNSISLSDLNLTPYKALFIVFNNIDVGATQRIFINQTSVQTGGGLSVNSPDSQYGTAWIDLNTGVIGGGISAATVPTPATVGESVVGGLTTVTTASTAIHFRADSTNTFTAAGSIRIYGVT